MGNEMNIPTLSPQMMKAIEDAPLLQCECGNHTFVEGYAIKKVSGLLLGTPEDHIIPIPVYICSKCGKINADVAKMMKTPENVYKEEEKKPVLV